MTAAAAERRYTLSRRLRGIVRARRREKARFTRELRAALLKWWGDFRDHFFASSGLGPYIREADSQPDDQLHNADKLTGAANAITGDQLAAVLGAQMRAVYSAGATSAKQEVEQRISGDFDIPMTKAIAAVDAYTLKFAGKVADREKAALKALIRQSIKDGTGTRALASQVSDFFDDGVHMGDGRVMDADAWAELVARTETTRAYLTASLDVYDAAGVQHVQWLTSEDERTCPECDALDGETAEIGGEFSDGTPVGEANHPDCRCDQVAVDDAADVDDDGEDD